MTCQSRSFLKNIFVLMVSVLFQGAAIDTQRKTDVGKKIEKESEEFIGKQEPK